MMQRIFINNLSLVSMYDNSSYDSNPKINNYKNRVKQLSF